MANRIHKSVIVVFAKIPQAGFAKSRIATVVGLQKADEIYRELLQVTAKVVSGFNYHVAFTGALSPGILKEYFPEAQSYFVQCGESLGDRLRSGFEYLFRCGLDSVVAIGCDCPSLDSNELTFAMDSLATGTDIVVGPAEDGGYYLIGGKPNTLSVFDVKSWSLPTLFTDTMHVINENNYKYEILPIRSDIDTIDTYYHWKGTVK